MDEQERPPLQHGRNALTCVIPGGLLNTGRYDEDMADDPAMEEPAADVK